LAIVATSVVWWDELDFWLKKNAKKFREEEKTYVQAVSFSICSSFSLISDEVIPVWSSLIERILEELRNKWSRNVHYEWLKFPR